MCTESVGKDDKVIRSTHGVNCTGSCSWNIYVKDGIVTWEGQELNYPTTLICQILNREDAHVEQVFLGTFIVHFV